MPYRSNTHFSNSEDFIPSSRIDSWNFMARADKLHRLIDEVSFNEL
jgi:hypothetical protein